MKTAVSQAQTFWATYERVLNEAHSVGISWKAPGPQRQKASWKYRCYINIFCTLCSGRQSRMNSNSREAVLFDDDKSIGGLHNVPRRILMENNGSRQHSPFVIWISLQVLWGEACVCSSKCTPRAPYLERVLFVIHTHIRRSLSLTEIVCKFMSN